MKTPQSDHTKTKFMLLFLPRLASWGVGAIMLWTLLLFFPGLSGIMMIQSAQVSEQSIVDQIDEAVKAGHMTWNDVGMTREEAVLLHKEFLKKTYKDHLTGMRNSSRGGQYYKDYHHESLSLKDLP